MPPSYRKIVTTKLILSLSVLVAPYSQAADFSSNNDEPIERNSDTTIKIKRVKRAHIPFADKRWPNRTIPYVLTNASVKTRQAFLEGIKEISRNSGIMFIEATNERDYIYLTDHHNGMRQRCTSHVGRQGGPQALSLSPSCYERSFAVLHELMHAIGFKHEHERPDSDQFVDVTLPDPPTNPCEPYKHPSMKEEISENEEISGIALNPYDFHSVTHYRIGPKSVLQPRDPAANIRTSPRTTLSTGDIAALDILYGGMPKNMGQAPTDNGLSVELSKRELILTAGSIGKVEWKILPNVPLASRPNLAEETNPHITATGRSLDNNSFAMNIHTTRAMRPGRYPVVMEFKTEDGRFGTAVVVVRIVTPKVLPLTFRQLVSLWKPTGSNQKYCLEAQRLAANTKSFPANIDRVAWMASKEDTQMSVKLASCDGDNPLQLWAQDDDGHLVSRAVFHRLALAEPIDSPPGIANINTTRVCDIDTLSPKAQWRFENGKLINTAFPRSALSYTAGEVPALFPIENRPVPWQQWRWY